MSRLRAASACGVERLAGERRERAGQGDAGGGRAAESRRRSGKSLVSVASTPGSAGAAECGAHERVVAVVAPVRGRACPRRDGGGGVARDGDVADRAAFASQ